MSVLAIDRAKDYSTIADMLGLISRSLLYVLALASGLLHHAVNAQRLADLPEPVTNNAVAKVSTDKGDVLVSLLGLGAGKTFRDVHNKVWTLSLSNTSAQWQSRTPVPSSLPSKGRLAAVAVSLQSKLYVFGGYTVGADHSEITSPDNFLYDVVQDKYTAIAATPVPVDDAVALTFKDRYIYLISGWHNDGNVNLVQVYDSFTDRWQQATPFVGKPVFGHAGAIKGEQMLVCDGVAVQSNADKRREFAMESACYIGRISADSVLKIDWRNVSHPTAKGRYRMAATADPEHARLIFVGGSVNPYNYNGIGYDGQPSEPDFQVWVFDLITGKWSVHTVNQASMDHRSLLAFDGSFWVIGGMGAKQVVLKSVTEYKLH